MKRKENVVTWIKLERDSGALLAKPGARWRAGGVKGLIDANESNGSSFRTML